ncbi:MAG: hypothetical protein J6V98_08365 [Bacteroidales bacterium]|nr:hypothetical protein [Bacteroidales bacterium]
MNRNVILTLAALLLAGCWGSRFVSADTDLENIYVGKTYYEVVDEFGRPDATIDDGRDGTKIAYNAVSLNGTRAASLYQLYTVRNKATRVTGAPVGGITFSFDADMKCYAVDSDFQRERVKEEKRVEKGKPQDMRRPNKVKPKIPRTIEFPYIEDRSPNADVVSIEKVEVDKFKLKVYLQYRDRTPARRPVNDYGISVMPEVYVEDVATGNRYALQKAEGITLYPDHTHFAHNAGGYDVLLYSLTFDPVPEDTEFINIIEPGHSGYNFYRVDIRTPMSSKEELKNQ